MDVGKHLENLFIFCTFAAQSAIYEQIIFTSNRAFWN